MRLYSIYKWLLYVPGLVLVTFVNFLDILIVAPFSEGNLFSGEVSEHGHNLFAPAKVDLSTWSDTGDDLMVDDPGLTGGYRPRDNSLAVDAAAATIYDVDLSLNPVPCGAAPDIGAFEYCD